MLLAHRQPVSAPPRLGGLPPMHLLDREYGQLHELPFGRTTIGSSAKCSLRLERPGVQPLHCLVVHGAEGVSVRRWAADARVNGALFTDAPLSAGDCLAIGGVELELVQDTCAAAEEIEEATPETFLDETDASCSQLMDVVQQSVSAITELETVSDGEVTGGVSAIASVKMPVFGETEEFLGSAEGGKIPEVGTAVEVESEADFVEAAGEVVEAAELVERGNVGNTDEALQISADVVAAPGAGLTHEDDETVELVEPTGMTWSCAAVEMPRDSEANKMDGTEGTCESSGAVSADFEAMPAEFEPGLNAARSADISAEIVFRELQAACAVARGRARRMLNALRNERQQNHELLTQLTDVGKQLSQLQQHSPAGEPSSEWTSREFAEWQSQWAELRQHFALWEAKLDEHTRRMAELQQELVEARDQTPAGEAHDVVAASKSSGSMVALPVADVEIPTTGSFDSTVDAELSQDAWTNEAAPTESEFVATGESLHSTLWEEAAMPSVEETPSTFDESPQLVEAANADELAAEPEAVIPEEISAGGLVADDVSRDWEPETPAESSIGGSKQLPVANDTNPWAMPVVESAWESESPLSDAAEEASLRKSIWRVPPLPADDVANSCESDVEAGSIEVDTPVWATGTTIESDGATDDVSPFAEFSIWKQGASTESVPVSDSNVCEQPAFGSEAIVPAAWDAEPTTESGTANVEHAAEVPPAIETPVEETAQEPVLNLETPEPAAETATSAPVSPRKSQPVSFIERYSHLLEESSASEPDVLSPQRLAAEQPSIPSGALGSGFNTAQPDVAARSDEEESIEQYMAKLMQRVRGEVPRTEPLPPVAIQRPARPAINTLPNAGGATATGEAANSVQSGAQDANAGEKGSSTAEVTVDWDAIARRAAATAPKADMGALRALANETARRAIGRHELRKHRRDAVTKIIVSSLAGVTSVWLMLDSPSWRDIQFITACVSLVAAAYWAGETFREMLESLRAATYHGPETAKEHEATSSDIALPIDVAEE